MRYCTKCGKVINYDSSICVDCVAKAKMESENNVRAAYTPAYPSVPVARVNHAVSVTQTSDTKMDGFGMALTSTILASVAFFFSMLMIGFSISAMLGFLILFINPPIVISLIFGIKSITLYNKYSENKPVPTLVLGIVGVSLSGMALLFSIL